MILAFCAVYNLYRPILLPLVSVLFSLGLARQIRQRKGCWPHQKSPGPDEAKLKNIFTIFKNIMIIEYTSYYAPAISQHNCKMSWEKIFLYQGRSVIRFLENIFAQDQVLLAAKCETAQKIHAKWIMTYLYVQHICNIIPDKQRSHVLCNIINMHVTCANFFLGFKDT